MENELTEKQKRFCQEYVIDLNGTAAMVRAGFSAKAARTTASYYLKKAGIKAYVKELQEQIALELKINAKTVIEELARVAFADMADYLDEKNRLREVKSLTNRKSAAIQSVKVIEIDRDDAHTVITYFRLHNKTVALERLGRHLGVFATGDSPCEELEPLIIDVKKKTAPAHEEPETEKN